MMEFINQLGIIISISDFFNQNINNGCTKIISIEGEDKEITNFIVNQDTYILDNISLKVGDQIHCYYDALAPAPLIYPPQFKAIVIIKKGKNYFFKVDFFNDNLISSDGMLKIKPNVLTKVVLENGLYFTGSLYNRNLIVLYKMTTRSIPAITYPNKIIVLCNKE